MKLFVMLYGVLSYLLFFLVFVCFIAFVGDFFVPQVIASESVMDASNALLIDLGLILLWGVQHTVMARGWFKEAIAGVIPKHVERSTYVLVSAVVLAFLMYFWQPMEGVLWQIESSTLQQMIWGLFAIGWLLVFVATFLTDHFDLFGLRQTWLYYVGKSYTSVKFTERLFYRSIRHPMMLGLLIAFWAVPRMTTDHLVFSAGMTVYIIIGIYFEERGLARTIGAAYQEYQGRTSKIIPKIY